MRNRLLAAASLLALVPLAPPLRAQDEEAAGADKGWQVEVGYDYASRYLFRGLDLLGGEGVHVGHVSDQIGNLNVYWYGYFGEHGDGEDGRRSYSENDFGIDYTLEAGRFALTAGAAGFTYRALADAHSFTTEVYAIAALDVLLQPTLSWYYDVDLYEGSYVTLAVSHQLDVGHSLALTPSAAYGYSFGWTESAFELESNRGPSDLLLGLDLAFTWRAITLHALAQHSIALRQLEAAGEDDVSLLTLGAAYTF